MKLAGELGGASMALKRARVAQGELEVGVRSRENAGAAEVEQQFRAYLSHGNRDRLSDVGKRSIVGYIGEPKSIEGLRIPTAASPMDSPSPHKY